ncbi:MAG TPA: hypothetical protein VNU71_10330, partial [Burkholderiaceae bacterium]|nr:hypothetical protein [Burkholderiaceae bacterium]
ALDAADDDTLSPPHERALAAAFGWHGADGTLPFAARAAATDGIAVGTLAWGLVTPCHWLVGRDHVTLVDPAALELTEHESRAAFDAVRPLFEGDGFRFEWGAPMRWYAAHESLADLPCAALDRVIGRDVERWLRAGDDAGGRPATPLRRVRRLQAEWQLLLYPHPLNEAREQRGALTLNSFWLSGCGRFQPEHGTAPLVDERLREPLLAQDFVAWADAWRALDAEALGALLDASRDARVTLTLCGERAAQRFESAPSRGWWQRAGDRWRAPEPRAVLEAL